MNVDLTDQEKKTLTLALDSFLLSLADEVKSKKDIPGEKEAVAESLNHIAAIHTLYKKFGMG